MAHDQQKIRVLAHADSRIFSGAESLFCDVVAGLESDPRFEMVAAAPTENAELTDRLRQITKATPAPVSAQPLRLAAFHLLDPRRIRSSRQAISESSPDLLFLNLPSTEYGGTPLLSGLQPELPVLGLVHIVAGMKEHGFKFGGARESISRHTLKRLDRVCVVSDTAASTFHDRWGSRDRHPAVIRLREPSAGTVSRDQARLELQLEPGHPVIGIAGRLTTKQKGHDTLIEASRRLIADRPEIRFLVAGEGPDLKLLQDIAETAGVAENWIFLGQVQPLDVFYSAVDLIAIPSRFEGLPLVALEAIEAGRPGVASSVDGLADVWPEEWQVPPDDPEALAERLAGLLDASRPELDAGLEEARRRMSAHVTGDPSEDVGAVLMEMAASSA